MKNKTILITGLGGNVGQGIAQNIRKYFPEFKLVGTNTIKPCAGMTLVDYLVKVPLAIDAPYISELTNYIEKFSVDLVIPSTDFEASVLASNLISIPSKVAVASEKATSGYLDKYESFQMHRLHGIPFAESLLPSQFHWQFPNAIAKPRKGRGSRGIQVLNESCTVPQLDDCDYVIQRYYFGNEITCAIYASYLTGDFHGLITFKRDLQAGTTVYCERITQYDQVLEKIAKEIIEAFDIRGSFNIQCIVTQDEDIVPFEINCRISGTNSIRDAFGFHDVVYTVNEKIYNMPPADLRLKNGFAFRYYTDEIFLES